MHVKSMNFNSVEVCGGPTFKHSLSHQIKKLMCYNRHLNRKQIGRSSSTVELDSICQPSNNTGIIINSNVSQADILRTRYDKNYLSLQKNILPAIDRSMPKQKFGDIVKGMMTMPELPPFGSADIQQVVRLCDIKSEKRTDCERTTQGRCRGLYNNDVPSGSSLYSQDASYRRTFPPPSGVDKPAFLDFPSSSSSYKQRDLSNLNFQEDIEPHCLPLAEEFEETPIFSFEKTKQKVPRNSSFQVYQRDELLKDNCRKQLHLLEETPSNSYSLDFPIPSGADKVAFLDCPTTLPDKHVVEKSREIPFYGRHEELQQPLFSHDHTSESIQKLHCGSQIQVPHIINDNQLNTPNKQPCVHRSQMSQKRKPCTRMISSDTSPLSCYHNHRKHHSSCNRKTPSNLMDLSSNQESDLCEFQMGNPFNIDSSSIHSPTSTINSADINFTLLEGPDFQQNKPSTSVPQRRGPGRPRKPENERKRKPTKSIPLWKFLLNMLHDPATCPELVRWEDTSKGMFRIVRSDMVAAKWGMRKDNTKMNYEKFSRAMRYYYKQHIFEAVPGKRLVYQFGRAAKEWKPKDMTNPNFEQRRELD